MEDNQRNELLVKLRVQIEYYLSDENLKGDKFFHEKISSDIEGFLDIALLLNCNKIKNLGVNKEDIVTVLRNSTVLELSSDCERVRRVDNKALPELKLLAKKRKADQDIDEAAIEEVKKLDPTILEIHSDKEIDFKWKEIQDEFKRINPELKVIYLRFNGQSGHIGLNGGTKWTETFRLNGCHFTIKKCESDNLIEFWKDHGSHIEMCIGRNNRDGRSIRDKKIKQAIDLNKLKSPLKLGAETFTEIPRIKARSRKIFSTANFDEKITGDDHQFLVDLLKHHRNSSEKLKDLSHFIVSPHSEHTYSRCFFIVRNDDTKEDFSAQKCIEHITNMNK